MGLALIKGKGWIIITLQEYINVLYSNLICLNKYLRMKKILIRDYKETGLINIKILERLLLKRINKRKAITCEPYFVKVVICFVKYNFVGIFLKCLGLSLIVISFLWYKVYSRIINIKFCLCSLHGYACCLSSSFYSQDCVII